MQKNIVFENKMGEIVRTLSWTNNPLFVIQRKDTQRVDVCEDTEAFEARNIPFQILRELAPGDWGKPQKITNHITARLVADAGAMDARSDEALSEDDGKVWRRSLGLMLILFLIMGTWFLRPTEMSEELEAELKEHVAKIVKKQPKRVQIKPRAKRFVSRNQKVKKTIKPVKKSVNRMGALGVLGSLSKSKQRGGINLGAAQTTAGPGLGGTAGSGGVQTSLYGKGLKAAPVGVGGNLQGGGGYGTKGKGGGKAGYGKLSLIGSAGNSTIPLGREAIIKGGIDRSLISDVVRRNMGQIRFCYEQGLQSSPSIAGRVMVNWTIGPDGRVTVAGIRNTSLHSKIVESCMVRRIKTWKFPLPEGGQAVPVAFPFMLKRQGRG